MWLSLDEEEKGKDFLDEDVEGVADEEEPGSSTPAERSDIFLILLLEGNFTDFDDWSKDGKPMEKELFPFLLLEAVGVEDDGRPDGEGD